jgi:hypothetical protein
MALSNFYFKKSIIKFGEAYIKELTKQLLAADKKATGELIQSLDYKLIESSNEILLAINAKAYLINVDKGRKKGAKMIPGTALMKWAKLKGFRPGKFKGIEYKTYEDIGWAISRKIQKTGIKQTNVLSKAKDALFNNKKVIDELMNGGLLDLEKLIDDTFKQLKDINIKKI